MSDRRLGSPRSVEAPIILWYQAFKAVADWFRPIELASD
jgi:hypothetical protein